MGLLPWLLVTVVIVIHGGGTGGGLGRVTAERVDHVRIVEESEERTERTEIRVRRSSLRSKQLSTKRECADSGFRDTFTAAVADALGLSETERASIVLREHQTEALNGLAKSFELRSGGQSAGRVVDADEALRHVLLRCVDEPPSVVCRDRDTAADSTTPKPKQSKAKKDKDSSSSSSPACPEGAEESSGGSFDRVEELAVAVIAALSLAGNLWGAAKAFCAKHCAGGAYQSVSAAAASGGAADSTTEREAVATGAGKALTPTERAALARAEANNNNNVDNSGSSYYPAGTGGALLPSQPLQQQQFQYPQQPFQQPQAVFVVAGEPQQQPQHQHAALNASGASSSSSVAAAAALNQSLRRQRQDAAAQPLLVIAPPPQPAAARINSTAFFSPSASAPSPSLSTILSPNPTNPANLYPTIQSNPTNPYYPNSTNPTNNTTSNPFVDGASGGGDYTTDSGFGQY